MPPNLLRTQAFSHKLADRLGYHRDNLYNHSAENRDEAFLLNLLTNLTARYDVDPERIYLAGRQGPRSRPRLG